MNILVIDDDMTRLNWFLDTLEPAGYDVRIADDVELALDQLSATVFDLAFFDHDLGEASTSMLKNRRYENLPGGDPNGSRLLGYAMQFYKRFHLPRHIWVHSANPVGAKNIAAKCNSAEIPYVISDYGEIIKDPEGFLAAVENFLNDDA